VRQLRAGLVVAARMPRRRAGMLRFCQGSHTITAITRASRPISAGMIRPTWPF
jgi:hypothetical protein